MLERTYKLSLENNDLLRKIRRSNTMSSIFRAIYWVVIIGASVGAYYYVQPYVDPMMKIYSDIMANAQNLPNLLRGGK